MNNVEDSDVQTPRVGDSFVKFSDDVKGKPITSTQFTKTIKKRLASYKEENITTLPGLWHGVEYRHILPLNQIDKNLFGFTRDDVRKLPNQNNIKFHDGFAHLNSSQAMCMNFFYPLIISNKLELIAKLLQLPGTVTNAQFEKDSHIEKANRQKTNFDFYFEVGSKKVYFEIKYTESEFGQVKSNTKYRDKYHDVYEVRSNNSLVFKNVLDEDQFLENYQIMRNFVVLDSNSYVVFIYPRDNHNIRHSILAARENYIQPAYFDHVILITWEELVTLIVQLDNSAPKIDYTTFIEKYFVV